MPSHGMRALLLCLVLLGCSSASSGSSGTGADPEPTGGGEGATCAEDACGPALGMPNQLCADGVHTSGPTGRCLPQADGSCGWEIAECPATDAVTTPGSAPMVCGTRGAAPCPSGTFCDFPAGSQCGATDGGGSCVAIPTACTREYRPVCGCDGQTHPTACVAHSAGVSVSHDGPC